MKVDATTTSFYTATNSYATSTHLDLKVTYNDGWKEDFSLNPYFEHWTELNNKATVQFNPKTSSQGMYVIRRRNANVQSEKSQAGDRHFRQFRELRFLSEI